MELSESKEEMERKEQPKAKEVQEEKEGKEERAEPDGVQEEGYQAEEGGEDEQQDGEDDELEANGTTYTHPLCQPGRPEEGCEGYRSRRNSAILDIAQQLQSAAEHQQHRSAAHAHATALY